MSLDHRAEINMYKLKFIDVRYSSKTFLIQRPKNLYKNIQEVLLRSPLLALAFFFNKNKVFFFLFHRKTFLANASVILKR